MKDIPASFEVLRPLVMAPYSLVRAVDSFSDRLGLEWLNEEWTGLQQLSQENRQAVVVQNFATYLYEHYFAGLPLPKPKPISSEPASLESAYSEDLFKDNDRSQENEAWFERLQKLNCGSGYFDPDWTVITVPLLAVLIVQKAGLTLRIQRDRHLQDPNIKVQVGDRIAIKMPANRVDSHYYQAIGNDGPPPHQQTVELFWNVTHQDAEPLMAYWSEQLNQASIPFCLKIFHTPALFERWDSGILQILKADYPALRPFIEAYWQTHQLNLRPNVPLGTLSLAPGLTVSECPEPTVAPGFGQHRCRLIAAALVQQETALPGDPPPTPMARWAAIEAEFRQHALDWHHPHLTCQGEDIYHPFNLSH